MKQFKLFKTSSPHQFSYGGTFRNQRKGRGQRPLSSKDPLHVVFKIKKYKLRSKSLRTFENFKLVHEIIEQYARRFFIRVEQCSVQADHIHLLIRTGRRSQFHHFFRVVAGQIAQRFEKAGRFTVVTDTPKSSKVRRAGAMSRDESVRGGGVKEKPWKHRPFSRVVRGWRAYVIVRDYIQLNEMEILGRIPYRKERLRGLSLRDWEILWS